MKHLARSLLTTRHSTQMPNLSHQSDLLEHTEATTISNIPTNRWMSSSKTTTEKQSLLALYIIQTTLFAR